MPQPRRRRSWLAAVAVVALALPPAAWLGLTYRPPAYRALRRAELTDARRHREARRFVSHSLQLRNDIDNEPVWEAAFTDGEVNAWLAEDLVATFADQIPAEVHEPRVAFEDDRVILAFELDRGPIRSVITVACRARVVEDNVLALTLEKVHAGIVPLPTDRLIDGITYHARRHGLRISWRREEGGPTALIRYTTDPTRRDVVLERVQVLRGELRMGGRSSRAGGHVEAPTLPGRRLLQARFPILRRQAAPPSHPGATRVSRTSPAI